MLTFVVLKNYCFVFPIFCLGTTSPPLHLLEKMTVFALHFTASCSVIMFLLDLCCNELSYSSLLSESYFLCFVWSPLSPGPPKELTECHVLCKPPFNWLWFTALFSLCTVFAHGKLLFKGLSTEKRKYVIKQMCLSVSKTVAFGKREYWDSQRHLIVWMFLILFDDYGVCVGL